MGWLFCSSVKTKAEMIARLTRAERFDAGFELLKSTAVRNNHWYLIRRKEDGLISIGLDKMESGGREGWGYKDMSEFSGPCEKDCPLSFLDAASEPTGYAVAWREKVRKHHAEKRLTRIAFTGLSDQQARAEAGM
jgi:hypothetical protein